MPTETELKLALEGVTAGQLQTQPEIRAHAVGTAREQQLDNIYFDTATLSLRRRDVALRLRRNGNRWLQTVKTSGSTSAGLHRRGEWEIPVAGEALELDRFDHSRLRKLFEKPGLRRTLIPIFRTDFQRTTWDLQYPRGVRVEMALDLGQIRAGEHTETISEVELELIAGKPEDLLKTGRALAATLPVRLLNVSKAERGYRLGKYTPPAGDTKSGPLGLHKKTSAEQAFIAILRQGMFRLQANEPLVLAQPRDIEGVHQMRVATRRMRSCLQLFRPLISKTVSADTGNSIRWLTDALGPARDWDVFIEETLQPLGQEFPQHRTLESHPIDRQRLDIVAVPGFLFADQLDCISRFVAIGGQYVQRGNQFTIRIHHDVQEVTVIPLTMLATADVRIYDAACAVATLGVLVVCQNLMRQLADRHQPLPGLILHSIIRQYISGTDVTVSAVIKVRQLQVEIKFSCCYLKNLQSFSSYLRAGTITTHNCNVICLSHFFRPFLK